MKDVLRSLIRALEMVSNKLDTINESINRNTESLDTLRDKVGRNSFEFTEYEQ